MEYAWALNGTLSLLGGFLAYMIMHGILSLRVYRMQAHIADLQQGLLQLRNRGAGESRWEKKAKQDVQLEQFLNSAKPEKVTRFANDPLGE